MATVNIIICLFDFTSTPCPRHVLGVMTPCWIFSRQGITCHISYCTAHCDSPFSIRQSIFPLFTVFVLLFIVQLSTVTLFTVIVHCLSTLPLFTVIVLLFIHVLLSTCSTVHCYCFVVHILHCSLLLFCCLLFHCSLLLFCCCVIFSCCFEWQELRVGPKEGQKEPEGEIALFQFHGADETILFQLARLPWQRQLELLAENGSCDLPGFAEQANPAENLLWILVGFDVATMAYPEHQQFNSQEPL